MHTLVLVPISVLGTITRFLVTPICIMLYGKLPVLFFIFVVVASAFNSGYSCPWQFHSAACCPSGSYPVILQAESCFYSSITRELSKMHIPMSFYLYISFCSGSKFPTFIVFTEFPVILLLGLPYRRW